MRNPSVWHLLGVACCIFVAPITAKAVVIADFDFASVDGDMVPNAGVGADGILSANATVADGVLDLDNTELNDVMDEHGMSIPLGLNNPFGGGTNWRVSFDFSTEDAPGGSVGALFSSDGSLFVGEEELNDAEQVGSLNIYMSGDGAIVADAWFIGAIEGGVDLNDGEVHNIDVTYTADESLWELSIDGELVAEEPFEYLRDSSQDRVRVGGLSNVDFGFEIDEDADAFDVTIDNLIIEGTPAPDLNGDGDIDTLDWDLFVAGFGTDLSGLSELDAFNRGDLNADGLHSSRDFMIFSTAFDAANGEGAMAAMTANVPEPATLGMLGLGLLGLLSLRRRTSGASPTLAVALLLALGGPLFVAQDAQADLLVEYLFDSGNAEDDIADSSGNGVDGETIGFDSGSLGGTITFTGEQEIVVPLLDANPFDGSQDFSIEMVFSLGFHEEDEAGHLLFSSANALDPTAGVEHSMSIFVTPESEIIYDNFFVGDVAISPPEEIIDDGQFHNLLVTFQAPEELGENPDEPNPGLMMMRFDDVWYEGGEIAPNIVGIEDHEVIIGATLNEDFPYECEGLECWIRPLKGELDSVRVFDESFAPTQLTATVDRATGDVIFNGGEFGRDINYYELSSEGGALNSAAWSSGNLDSQNLDAVGDGSGQTWDVLTGDENRVVEAFLMGSTALEDGVTVTLPGAWNGTAEDLELEIVTTSNESLSVDVSYMGEGTGNQGVGVVCDPNTGGDLDGNGRVEFADFLILSAGFGNQVASHAEGDIDCNGSVEFSDFLVLSANFGTSVAAESASVPEPNTAVMLSCLLLVGSAVRRRR